MAAACYFLRAFYIKELCGKYLCKLRPSSAFSPQLPVARIATRLAIAEKLHQEILQFAFHN